MENRLALSLSTATLVAAALSACGSSPANTATPTPSATPTVTVEASASPTSTPEASATAEALVTPAAPSSVDTPAERAAWEALMAPTGEYASAASYQAVIDRFGQVQPYTRIESQEQRHIAALTRQLNRMGVIVPANPYLDQIAAPADLVTAAKSWATGEVKNIALYDGLLSQAADDAQLTRVFTSLRRASLEEHLPAFEAAAANGGVSP